MPERLYSLDALRGVAALVVIFWHWQHFFYRGTQPGRLAFSDLPLFDVFFLFYTQ
jgi:peptidoglycan/LPS O-acetylase OafA/YrhL